MEFRLCECGAYIGLCFPLLNCAGEVNAKVPEWRLNESSPRLFSGIGDFDSPSPAFGNVSNLTTLSISFSTTAIECSSIFLYSSYLQG